MKVNKNLSNREWKKWEGEQYSERRGKIKIKLLTSCLGTGFIIELQLEKNHSHSVWQMSDSKIKSDTKENTKIWIYQKTITIRTKKIFIDFILWTSFYNIRVTFILKSGHRRHNSMISIIRMAEEFHHLIMVISINLCNLNP